MGDQILENVVTELFNSLATNTYAAHSSTKKSDTDTVKSILSIHFTRYDGLPAPNFHVSTEKHKKEHLTCGALLNKANGFNTLNQMVGNIFKEWYDTGTEEFTSSRGS